MLVYGGQGDDKGVSDLWTKDYLIAVRNFEKEVKALAEYKRTCLASPKVGGAKDEVEC